MVLRHWGEEFNWHLLAWATVRARPRAFVCGTNLSSFILSLGTRSLYCLHAIEDKSFTRARESHRICKRKTAASL